MDFYSIADDGIAKELGSRFKAHRLNTNLTQQELAESAGLSLNAIKNLEAGRCSLSTLIAAMRELHLLNELDHFAPPAEISPMAMAALKGKKRKRASRRDQSGKNKSKITW